MNAIRESGRKVGMAIANYVSVLNPSRIVLGGSLTEAGLELASGVREVIYRHSFPIAAESIRVVVSQSGSRAAILGASALATDRFLSRGTVA